MVRIVETATRLIVTGEAEELELLRERLRYHPNGYFHSDSYQLYKMTGGDKGWDGYRYPFVLKTNMAGEALRGHKEEIIAQCQADRFKLDVSRCLESPFAGLLPKDVTDDLIQSNFVLDDSQKGAVVQWLRHGIGVANMAVNAGKTATFAAAAALIKRSYPEARFLYFTFTERLVKQVMAGMQDFLPGWNITQFGGGKRDNTGADMVIATQAMLSRNFVQLKRENWFISFHGLLLDESHHSASETAGKVILATGAFFRLGASDTIKEADPAKAHRIRGLCGPVRWTVSSSELIDQGRSAAPTLYLVDVPEWKNRYRDAMPSPELDSTAWTLIDGEWRRASYVSPVYELKKNGDIKMVKRRVRQEDEMVSIEVPKIISGRHLLTLDGKPYEADATVTLLDRRYDKAIIRFKERNNLILQWAKYYSEKKWPTVVVATRTPHVLILEALLTSVLGTKVRALIGAADAKERDAAFTWVQEPGNVLVTPLIKEGVSINALKAGVIADPVADFEVAKQIIGRFMRKKEDNRCYLTWFVDSQHPRYLGNTADLMDKLVRIEGFTFYHPVTYPSTITSAIVHHGQA